MKLSAPADSAQLESENKKIYLENSLDIYSSFNLHRNAQCNAHHND